MKLLFVSQLCLILWFGGEKAKTDARCVRVRAAKRQVSRCPSHQQPPFHYHVFLAGAGRFRRRSVQTQQQAGTS